MNTNKVALGIAVGAAVLATVGILIAKRKKTSKNAIDSKNLSETYMHKLNNLERRAKKEFKNVLENGEEISGKINGILKKAQTSFQ